MAIRRGYLFSCFYVVIMRYHQLLYSKNDNSRTRATGSQNKFFCKRLPCLSRKVESSYWRESASEKRARNTVDKFAVAVVLEQKEIVGHLPFNLAPVVSQFLKRDCNKGFAIVTGSKVNRGAGYGLEVSCTYKLYGPRLYVAQFKQIVKTIQSQGQT